MGNDVTQYRMAVGIFNSSVRICRHKYTINYDFNYVLIKFLLSLQRLSQLTIYKYLNSLLACAIIVVCADIICFILLLSGDVEPNPGPYNGTLDLLHLNIRSLRNKLEFIKDNLLNFDIMCFTETHLTEVITDEQILIDDFYHELFRKDFSSHSSGLIVYVKQSLLSRRILDLENPRLHTVWLEVKLHNFNTLVCCFYRPPNSDVTFWNDFEIMIDKALDLNKNVIMLGDINEDQFKHNARLSQSVSLYNMHNVISQATRVTANTATLIDPILVSDTISCLNSEVIVIPQTVSDHHATAIHVTIPLINSKPIQRNIWLYKYADFDRLNNLITCTNWEFIHDSNVNEATVMFTNKLIELMKLCIPNKLVTVRPNDKPWYDSSIRTMARKRDRQKHISIDNPTSSN